MDNVICCIMAGGRGERFWPESTDKKPKQLLKIGTERTLVETTVNNLTPFIPRNQIIISTAPHLATAIKTKLPDLDYWIEPVGRDTAACIGYCAFKSLEKGKDSVLIFVGADYHIADKKLFQDHLSLALRFAREGKIITLGIQPSRPSVDFGYIEPGYEILSEETPFKVYSVKQFVEKPDRETAVKYMNKGFLWNSGMFIFKTSTILSAFKKHLPGHYSILQQIFDSKFDPVLSLELFQKLERISIDYGIMEKEKNNLVVIRSTFGWDDLGDWKALERHYDPDPDNNIV
ncbi:MAG: mannose-1-phosphate guanylyltransferase, partial [Candidatus Hodarchaeales archaeon]